MISVYSVYYDWLIHEYNESEEYNSPYYTLNCWFK